MKGQIKKLLNKPLYFSGSSFWIIVVFRKIDKPLCRIIRAMPPCNKGEFNVDFINVSLTVGWQSKYENR